MSFGHVYHYLIPHPPASMPQLSYLGGYNTPLLTKDFLGKGNLYMRVWVPKLSYPFSHLGLFGEFFHAILRIFSASFNLYPIFLFVAKDLVNRLTDMVLLYSEASDRSREGFCLFWEGYPHTPIKKRNWLRFNFSPPKFSAFDAFMGVAACFLIFGWSVSMSVTTF